MSVLFPNQKNNSAFLRTTCDLSTYHQWYAYHRLGTPALDPRAGVSDLGAREVSNQYLLHLYQWGDAEAKRLGKNIPFLNLWKVFVNWFYSLRLFSRDVIGESLKLKRLNQFLIYLSWYF
jgi:hypothetical protein